MNNLSIVFNDYEVIVGIVERRTSSQCSRAQRHKEAAGDDARAHREVPL